MLTNPTLLNKVDLRKYDNSLSTAIADTDLVGKTLVVTEAVTCGNITIPDTIALEILNGGSISVNAGATLSVNGPYDSCVETPFLGSGSVVINSPVKNNNHDNLTGTSVHGLGTASTADVTTSATDTTTGRLLKVGDFGIGGICAVLPIGTDIDTLHTTGFYMGDQLLNAPSSEWYYIEVFEHGAAGYTYQRAIKLTSNVPVVYERMRVSGSWQSWLRQINQNNILASGIPAQSLANGAIIERGSNANGEYVKFADGTLICAGALTSGTSLTSTVGSVFTTGVVNRVFPVAFIAAPVVTPTGFASSGNLGWTTLYENPTNTGVTLLGVCPIDGPVILLQYVAIGRWY